MNNVRILSITKLNHAFPVTKNQSPEPVIIKNTIDGARILIKHIAKDVFAHYLCEFTSQYSNEIAPLCKPDVDSMTFKDVHNTLKSIWSDRGFITIYTWYISITTKAGVAFSYKEIVMPSRSLIDLLENELAMNVDGVKCLDFDFYDAAYCEDSLEQDEVAVEYCVRDENGTKQLKTFTTADIDDAVYTDGAWVINGHNVTFS